MKQIFTYPANGATEYIDPNYVGDATSGLTRRVDELLAGTYKNWLGLDPVSDLGTTTNRAMRNFSGYINYFDSQRNAESNVTIYDFWEYPIVVATKNISAGPNDIQSGDTNTPGILTTTTTHTFVDGNLARVSGMDGSWGFLYNDQDFYVDQLTGTTMHLATDSGLTNKIDASGPKTFTDPGNSLDFLSDNPGDPDISKVLIDIGYDDTYDLDNFQMQFTTTLLQNAPALYLKHYSGTKWELHFQELVDSPLRLNNIEQYNTSPLELTVLETNPGKITTTASFGSDKRIYIDDSNKIEWASNDPAKEASGLYYLDPTGETNEYIIYKDENLTQTFDWATLIELGARFNYGRNYGSSLGYFYSEKLRITGLPSSALNTPISVNNITGGARYLNNLEIVVDNDDVVSLNGVDQEIYDADITSGYPNVVRGAASYINTDGTLGDDHATTLGMHLYWPPSSLDSWDGISNTPGTIRGAATIPLFDVPWWQSTVAGQNLDTGQGSSVVFDNIQGGDVILERVYDDANYTISGSEFGEKANVVNSGKATTLADMTTPGSTQQTQGTLTFWSDDPALREQTGYFTDDRTGVSYIGLNDDRATYSVGNLSGLVWKINGVYCKNYLQSNPGATGPNGETLSEDGWKLEETGNTDGAYVEYQLRSVAKYFNTTSQEWERLEDTNLTKWTFDNTVTGTALFSAEVINGTNPGQLRFSRALTDDELYIGMMDDLEIPVLGIPQVHTAKGLTSRLTRTSDPLVYETRFNFSSFPGTQQNGSPSTATAYAEVTPIIITDVKFARRMNNHDLDNNWKINLEQRDLTAQVDDYVTSTQPTDYFKIDQGDADGTITFDAKAATTGLIELSPNATPTYVVSNVEIIMPGNKQYQYLSGADTYSYGAKIDASEYWEPGQTSITTIDPSETAATFTPTLDSNGRLQSVSLDTGGLYLDPHEMLIPILNADDTYTPPTPTIAELQDEWDTQDQWDDLGYNSDKLWPNHVSPATASISQNSPSIIAQSQNGTKFARTSSYTKWKLEVEYPPMSADEFQIFHAVSQAVNGQSVPFQLSLLNKDGENILWSDFSDSTTTQNVLFRNDYDAGSKIVMFEGFDSFEQNAFKKGEVFFTNTIDNQNGSLVTVVNDVDANAFGEAKVRLAYPLRQDAVAGAEIEKRPEFAVVTLSSNDFNYAVDYNGLYYLTVSFDLDGWK